MNLVSLAKELNKNIKFVVNVSTLETLKVASIDQVANVEVVE